MSTDINTLRRLLREPCTIAVVGLSAQWHRPSYFAAKYMQKHGFKIVPVNPRYAASQEQILGESCYASLTDIAFAVDIVNVFRATQDVLPIAQQAAKNRRALLVTTNRCTEPRSRPTGACCRTRFGDERSITI